MTPMFCTTAGSIRTPAPVESAVSGVSLMWQIGHIPGRSSIAGGCMPQVHSCRVVGSEDCCAGVWKSRTVHKTIAATIKVEIDKMRAFMMSFPSETELQRDYKKWDRLEGERSDGQRAAQLQQG